MKIVAPMIITSRLLPGIRVGDASISVEIDGYEEGPRAQVRYYIDRPGADTYTAADVSAPVYTDDRQDGGARILRVGLATLLSFLASEAEAYEYAMRTHTGAPSEGWLCSAEIAAWASLNEDEIAMAGLELGEQD